MKYTPQEFRARLIEIYFESPAGELTERDIRRVDEFLAAYEQEAIEKLVEPQLRMLYYMYHQQDQNTDHLSFAMGVSRRSAINSANALVRKGFLYWDIPTSSNADMGYDLVIDRSMQVKENN